MPEYMTYERLEKIAKAVGAKFETVNLKRYLLDSYNFSSGISYIFRVMLSDGSTVEKTYSDHQDGWYKERSGSKYSYVRNLTIERDSYTKTRYYAGFFVAECTISNADIKKGIEMLQRKPIFVGTKQVSAIYVKQSGTIKPAKPYIRQSGQIKAL